MQELSFVRFKTNTFYTKITVEILSENKSHTKVGSNPKFIKILVSKKIFVFAKTFFSGKTLI